MNPVYPEVRQYLVSVMHEIVRNYDVDGLHLDYIRFPNEWVEAYGPSGDVPDYPRDPRTLAMFHRATGQTPDSAPAQWDSFRTGAVTRLVRDIRQMMDKTKKNAVLSAAVGATPDEAKHRHFQDAKTWIQQGFVDAVYPMNYDADMATYSRRLALWRDVSRKVPVVTGVMFDKRDARTVGGDGSMVERYHVRRATLANADRMEPYRLVRETVCDGECFNETETERAAAPPAAPAAEEAAAQNVEIAQVEEVPVEVAEVEEVPIEGAPDQPAADAATPEPAEPADPASAQP